MIISSLWFFLPAILGNAAPVISGKLPGLGNFDTPMDFGRTYRGKQLFGANKTWRGFLIGTLAATLMVGIQKYLFTHSLWALEHSWIDYRPASIWLLGPLMGAGTLVADAVESFFKRQRGIKPGQPWFPFDQIDYIIGGCLFSLPVVQLAFSQYVWIFATGFGLHLVTVFVFYHLGVRDKPI